jgi:hypothetical protein
MEAKLCIDCKHYAPERICKHPSLGFSYVDGKPKTDFASVMRLPYQDCKPEGLLFEPMEAVIYDMADIFPNQKG